MTGHERDAFRYWPSYCEENIWHLVNSPHVGGDRREVLWISNDAHRCELWEQRASSTGIGAVLWDYHVILAVCHDEWRIWDLDSRLQQPVNAGEYLGRTFPTTRDPGFSPPQFRVVGAAEFRKHFSSDRSHMQGDDGAWLVPPPPWEPIQAAAGPHRVFALSGYAGCRAGNDVRSRGIAGEIYGRLRPLAGR